MQDLRKLARSYEDKKLQHNPHIDDYQKQVNDRKNWFNGMFLLKFDPLLKACENSGILFELKLKEYRRIQNMLLSNAIVKFRIEGYAPNVVIELNKIKKTNTIEWKMISHVSKKYSAPEDFFGDHDIGLLAKKIMDTIVNPFEEKINRE